jgi:hypothetical protein
MIQAGYLESNEQLVGTNIVEYILTTDEEHISKVIVHRYHTI